MRLPLLLIAPLLMVLAGGDAFADPVRIRGRVRNDAIGMVKGDFKFSDVFETMVVVEKKWDNVKFYGDGRFLAYNGVIAKYDGWYRFRFMRGFFRVYTPNGDVTIGKTYINFGNNGIFNVFEFDKSVNLTDLAYDKEGIYAVEYVYFHGNKFEGKFYAGAYDRDRDNDLYVEDLRFAGGLSLMGHSGTFNYGFVANRIDTDRNVTGVFFKGDVEIGVNGSYAFHFNDHFNKMFSEAQLGIDYSFFDGKLVCTANFYYNERGASNHGIHLPSPNYYFTARYYIYGSLLGLIDEFLSTGVDCFANLVDESLLVIPYFNWVVRDGITLSFLFPVPIGQGDQEFSRDTAGHISAVVRVEGKF